MEMCFEVKVGYSSCHYFSTEKTAGAFLFSLLGDRSIEQGINLTLSYLPKVDVDWQLLSGNEKDKYVDLEHYRYAIKKTDWHYTIDNKYSVYKTGKDYDKRLEKNKWLKKNGWYEQYFELTIPEIPPTIEVPGTGPVQVQNDIEFGGSNYREGDEG